MNLEFEGTGLTTSNKYDTSADVMPRVASVVCEEPRLSRVGADSGKYSHLK